MKEPAAGEGPGGWASSVAPRISKGTCQPGSQETFPTDWEAPGSLRGHCPRTPRARCYHSSTSETRAWTLTPQMMTSWARRQPQSRQGAVRGLGCWGGRLQADDHLSFLPDPLCFSSLGLVPLRVQARSPLAPEPQRSYQIKTAPSRTFAGQRSEGKRPGRAAPA